MVKTSSILSHIVLVIYKTKNINTRTRTRNLQKKYDSELTYRYSPQDCIWLWIATTVDKLVIIERIFRVNANLTSTVDFWIKTCWVPTGCRNRLWELNKNYSIFRLILIISNPLVKVIWKYVGFNISILRFQLCR